MASSYDYVAMLSIFRALEKAQRRSVPLEEIVGAIDALRKDTPEEIPPVTYYCNKCGQFPKAQQHENCGYLAVPSDWKERNAAQH